MSHLPHQERFQWARKGSASTSSGREKVVHRNLLLCVNFLPLELEDEGEPSFDESTELSSDGTQDGVSEVVTRDFARDRTADWVLGSPAPSPPSDCPDADERPGDVELGDSARQRPASVSGGIGGMSSVNNPLATASSAVSRIRTRVCRLVKPVDRLIQNMTQRRICPAF